ncbi:MULTISPECIES: lasso peptide biosynthesis B2 protein [Sphingobium]|uniref:Lasso peptide biosynthesis B2 protein n=1 Tax=Sphingobium yanoikuyae TaxID=13690 RepID=A0A9X7UET8_SPHYA|nr:lasso peptide biosynthesis B2 protein [Sphingobium yanoikuyae]MDI1296615.1 lasso peptide biosynthesis B2 protein [bacterium]QNG46027.1 lasso peptide biosynthesis B2 protein [Sphingobium yanoikuyae]
MNAVILKPRVGYCDIGDRLVFLDVDRDRYLMIAPELEMAVRDLVVGRIVDAKGREALAATGLFISSHAATGSSHPFSGIRPTRALCDRDEVTSDKLAFGAHYVAAFLCLAFFHLVARYCPLRMRIFLATSLVRSGEKALLPSKISVLLAAFHSASLLFPRKDRCLADALALQAYLALCRLRTTIVFGVQLGPFQAHCWVQHGDVVLGQDIETVRAFRPVLALP